MQMVLDAGRLVEYDTPQNLLAMKKGLFYSLVEESGDKEELYRLARM
jgi:ABC-type multidrug transport system fused ATPase/permease subunit